MVTIKEVAADAGVSVGTVSKILNGLYVKEDNRLRVEASIKKLDYQVNTYARGLKAQKTYTAAIIVPDLINPFFALLVNYVEQVLAAIGYKLFVCNSHCNADRELHYINMAKNNKVDGLIAVTYSNTDEYMEAGLPLVTIDRHFKNQFCCVSSDNKMGGRLAAEKFAKTGCRNVIYIRNGSNLDGETLKRGSAFAEACSKHGVLSTRMDFGEETTLNRQQVSKIELFLEQCMKREGFAYDGIFTSSDVHAIVVKKKLNEMGIDVPDQVQIIGYDGMRILNVGDYPVSSIAQPVKEMAVACVENLLKLIAKETVPPEITLPVSFVDGGTTKKEVTGEFSVR